MFKGYETRCNIKSNSMHAAACHVAPAVRHTLHTANSDLFVYAPHGSLLCDQYKHHTLP